MADYLVDIMPKKIFASAAPLVPVSAVEPLSVAAAESPEIEIGEHDDFGVELDDVTVQQELSKELQRLESDAELQACLEHIDSAEFEQELQQYFQSEASDELGFSTEATLVGDAKKLDKTTWKKYGLTNDQIEKVYAHFGQKYMYAMMTLRSQVIAHGGAYLHNAVLPGWKKAVDADKASIKGKTTVQRILTFPKSVDYLMQQRSNNNLKKTTECGNETQQFQCRMGLVAAALYTRMYYTFVRPNTSDDKKPKYLSTTAVKRVINSKNNKQAVEKANTILEKYGMDSKNQVKMYRMVKNVFVKNNHLNYVQKKQANKMKKPVNSGQNNKPKSSPGHKKALQEAKDLMKTWTNRQRQAVYEEGVKKAARKQTRKQKTK